MNNAQDNPPRELPEVTLEDAERARLKLFFGDMVEKMQRANAAAAARKQDEIAAAIEEAERRSNIRTPEEYSSHLPPRRRYGKLRGR